MNSTKAHRKQHKKFKLYAPLFVVFSGFSVVVSGFVGAAVGWLSVTGGDGVTLSGFIDLSEFGFTKLPTNKTVSVSSSLMKNKNGWSTFNLMTGESPNLLATWASATI